MNPVPNTLIGRAALLIALLIILSQVAWFGIVRILLIPPLRSARANPIVSTLMMAQSVLETLPENQRGTFLHGLDTHSGFRIVPDTPMRAVRVGSHGRLPVDLEDHLRKVFGPSVVLRIDAPTHALWIRFPVRHRSYWLVLPGRRVRRLLPLDLLIWVAVGLIIAVIGAYLVIFRLNRHLHRVLDAARTIGRGGTPGALPETGPEEIRELSRGFNQMSEGLQKLDSERRIMLAGISHDLRTPLTRLRIGVELAGDAVEPALGHGMVQDIEDMDCILMQFLDYARDGNEEAPQFGDFNQIVFDICHRYSVSGSPIKTAFDETPGFKFRKLAIRRMLSNLIDNAVRYGGKEIEVITQDLRNRILLTVQDRGPGLRHITPAEIIKPFVRENQSRGDHISAGLGLTIADRIARMHGGQLQLSNRDGGGLIVSVELPYR